MKKTEIHEIENYRKFNISILHPTNTRGTRVKITEPKRYNNDKTQTVILSYDYEIGDIGQQGLNYLIEKGFKPIARCSEHKFYTILCDNWAEDFIELNGEQNKINSLN
tara:strand:+ start:90 stop:413 length:324 start_codon:yes stop_codon:yes gene_type:complete